jgi:nitroimidazol reductase NimA-like FMN-containing flavoprotein (pyridoxamine 5'-phosphate oxidase superfamily)
MRRKDREVTGEERIREILEKGKILRVAMMDGAYPYVLPLHYGYEWADGRLTFYMHGAREGRKVELMARRPKVGFELDCDVALDSGGDVPCRYGSLYASVIGRGTASLVEEAAEKIHGLRVLMRTQTGRDFAIDEGMAATVSVMRIDVTDLTAKSRPARP